MPLAKIYQLPTDGGRALRKQVLIHDLITCGCKDCLEYKGEIEAGYYECESGYLPEQHIGPMTLQALISRNINEEEK